VTVARLVSGLEGLLLPVSFRGEAANRTDPGLVERDIGKVFELSEPE